MNHHFPLLKSIAFILFSLLFIRNVKAQCTSSSAHNPATSASLSFTGSRFGFDIPNNALSADNVYATATAILAVLSGPTQNLTLTNFGFSVPSNATICGVVAVVKKKAANVNALSTVFDNSVKLVKAGVVGGNNKALVGNWTTTNTAFTYGGDADLWGLTLTPADVNASNFGVAFSANISGTISLIPSAQIDNIQLTVYYTLSSLPVVLSGFTATVNGNKVILHWKAEKEINFSHYGIERSADGRSYERIASVEQSVLSNEYTYIDAFPNSTNYYRLKMVDVDDSYEYSPVVSARVDNTADKIRLNPNAAKDHSTLYFSNCSPGKYRVEIVTGSGQITYSRQLMVNNNLSVPLSLVQYSKGLYLINVYSENSGFVQSVKLLRE